MTNILLSCSCKLQSGTAFDAKGSFIISDDMQFFVFDEIDNPELAHDSLSNHDYLSLYGETVNGEKITCDQAFIGGIYEAVFVLPNSEVKIGDVMEKCTQIDIPLINFNSTAFSYVYGRYSISVSGSKIRRNEERIAQYSGRPICKFILTIQSDKSMLPTDLKAFAHRIVLLLSFATGHWIYYKGYQVSNDLRSAKVYRKSVDGPSIKNGLLGKLGRLDKYLEQVLPSYLALNKEWATEFFYNCMVNILSTDKGFIEDRLFKLVQTIEIMADALGEKPETLPKLKELRKHMTSTLDAWVEQNIEHKGVVDVEIIRSRIGRITSSDTFMNRVALFLNKVEVDNSKIGLNIKLIKDARDKVAHTGRLTVKDYGKINDLVDEIGKGQFMVQLVLLDWLGFKDGLIQGYNKEYATYEKIEHYFLRTII